MTLDTVSFVAALSVFLDFEAAHPVHTGRKEVLIRNAFGISAARYYQRLNLILDTGLLLTQALEHDPITTRRLLRLRDVRAAQRHIRKVIPE